MEVAEVVIAMPTGTFTLEMIASLRQHEMIKHTTMSAALGPERLVNKLKRHIHDRGQRHAAEMRAVRH